MHAVLLLASFAAVSYLAPLRQAAVPPRATPVARATGVMQQTPGVGAKSMSSVPVSISTTGFNSRCISVRRSLARALALPMPRLSSAPEMAQ